MMQRKTKFQLSIFFILMGAVLCVFVCLEWYSRRNFSYVIDQAKTFGFVFNSAELFTQYDGDTRRLVPNVQVTIKNHYLSGQDVPMNINSLGFRGEEIDIIKPPGESRILFLGDSITWADYLPENQIFVTIAGKKLQEKNRGKKIIAINSGIGGIGLQEEMDILKDPGLKLSPDVVVLGFYLNDASPSWGLAGALEDRGWFRRRSVFLDQLFRSSQIMLWNARDESSPLRWVRLMNQLDWKTDPIQFQQLTEAAQSDWGRLWNDPKAWEIITEGFSELKNLSDKKHFKVAVLLLPVRFQVYANFLENQPQAKVSAIAKKFRFPVLDLLPIFRAENKQVLFYDHCDLNIMGNEIAGRAIAEFLTGQI